MIKLAIMFALFSGFVYYYDIDVRRLVDRSGAPQWLEAKGYPIKHNVAGVASGQPTTTPEVK
jgi:hypothetical protein